MDRNMMEALNMLGLLPEEYYSTPEAEGLERGEVFPMDEVAEESPKYASVIGGIKKAASVMLHLEKTGNTGHPSYDIAVETVERTITMLGVDAFREVIGLFGIPHCPLDDGAASEDISNLIFGKDSPYQTKVGSGTMPSLPDCMSIGGMGCMDQGKQLMVEGSPARAASGENAGHIIIEHCPFGSFVYVPQPPDSTE